jgi:hypothetical protein
MQINTYKNHEYGNKKIYNIYIGIKNSSLTYILFFSFLVSTIYINTTKHTFKQDCSVGLDNSCIKCEMYSL